jgi:hypothetical protein
MGQRVALKARLLRGNRGKGAGLTRPGWRDAGSGEGRSGCTPCQPWPGLSPFRTGGGPSAEHQMLQGNVLQTTGLSQGSRQSRGWCWRTLVVACRKQKGWKRKRREGNSPLLAWQVARSQPEIGRMGKAVPAL